MKILHIKHYFENAGILEMKILVIKKDDNYPEGIKYSLVFARKMDDGSYDGEFLRYDNYNREGHHRHVKGRKYPYKFEGPEKLVDDFLEDLRNLLMEEGIKIDWEDM
ncbi:toxin-antitoxin system TumE family protein [Persephonella sp.]